MVVGIVALFGVSLNDSVAIFLGSDFSDCDLVLVDFPATATFLTPEERAFVVWKKSESELSA